MLLKPEILLFLVGGLVAIVAIVGHYATAHARTRAEKELKVQMLEMGMPIEDIERVLLAGKELSSKEASRMAQQRDR